MTLTDYQAKADTAIKAVRAANPMHAEDENHRMGVEQVMVSADGSSAFVPCSCGVTLAIRLPEPPPTPARRRVEVTDGS